MKDDKLYILLTDTGTVLNRLIKMYTKDPFNHVSIAFDQELREVYSFGRKKMHNPIIGGFVRENVDHMLFRNANCAVYELDCTQPVTYWKIREYIRQFLLNQDNYRYNLIGLFGVMFHVNIQRDDAYFCSQFVASIFEYSGMPLFSKPCIFVTPGDFTEAPALRLIYSGRLGDYRSALRKSLSTQKMMGKLSQQEMLDTLPKF
jgi:hypothetical protein